MSNNVVPRIAITTGDPAGIGPELVAKALADPAWVNHITPVVIGDAAVLGAVVQACGLPLTVKPLANAAEASGRHGFLEVIDCHDVDEVQYGVVDARYGAAAIDYIETACKLAKSGDVDGLVTGPINKTAVWATGAKFPGHTEMLAHLFGVPETQAVTMFVTGKLRIFFLTRHLSLRAAIERLDVPMVQGFIETVAKSLAGLGIQAPHFAVAGLNPHNGEGGKMGSEEQEVLAPAVDRARQLGIDVVGPIPADAVFYQARQGRFDAVISLYHDQGHIAAKTLDFFGTVSCELGLPVIRTTVDSGTAFDIAGTWVADPRGQVAAMLAAGTLAPGVLAAKGGHVHR